MSLGAVFYGVGWERSREFVEQCSMAWVGERSREFGEQCSMAWIGSGRASSWCSVLRRELGEGLSCVVRDGEDWRVWVGEYCGEIAWILGRELVSIVARWRGL